MSEEKNKVVGYRNAAFLVRVAAELCETHPHIDPPGVAIGQYGSDHIRFHCYGYKATYDYTLPAHQREDAKRALIESQFNLIIEYFTAEFGELEWVANNPAADDSMSKNYFILTAVWRGMEIQLLAQRSDVGEEVGEKESGPQITQTDQGYMQAVSTKVTVWKPNIHLTALGGGVPALLAASSSLMVEA